MTPTNVFFFDKTGIVQLDDVLSAMGNVTPVSVEERYFAEQPVPASTLRFSFGDLNYDPTKDTTVASSHWTSGRAGGGTAAGYGGTWRKLNTRYTNIWDYTYLDNTLQNEWSNGSLIYEATPATRFWNDAEQNPIKIIASNTSGCKSFWHAFEGCWAIVDIWKLDMSDATDVRYAFSYCKNLKHMPYLDMSTASKFDMAFCYCFKLEQIDGIQFPIDNSKNYSGALTFGICEELRSIGGTIDLCSFTNINGMFEGCTMLSELNVKNTGRIKNFVNTFSACKSLPAEVIGALDTSAATNMSAMLSGVAILGDASGHRWVDIRVRMENITEIPQLALSKVTDCSYMFSDCDIQNIDTARLADLTGSVNVSGMFRRTYKCKSGILDAYAFLDTIDSAHTDCFLEAGKDSVEGRAELEQVPVSWGGLKEE